MKHTPAPWQLAKSEESKLIKVLNKYGTRIAGITPMENDEANARLIAAAPELLEALKTVLQLAEAGVIQRNETGKPQWNLTDELQTIAHAAILKAEG